MSGLLRRALAESTRQRRAFKSLPKQSPPSTFSPTSTSSLGLFGLPGLHAPNDWARLADDCIAESDRLVLAAASAPPTVAAVRALDDLSDAVCRVADAAELCRVAAARADWRAAAAAAASRLGAHVHGLNAHAGMASALAAAAEAEEGKRGPGLSREASRVADALLRDFARGGAFLRSAAARGAAAGAEAAAAAASVRFTDALADPDAGGVKFAVSYSNAAVAANPAAVASALRFEPAARLRRKCFEAAFSDETTQHLVRPLHAMLEARSKRAEVLGFGGKGWRGMLVDDDESDGGEGNAEDGNGDGRRRRRRRPRSHEGLASLAGSAPTVRSFLLDLAMKLRPLAEEQASMLSRAKKREGGGDEPLRPWDAAFFSAKVRAEAAAAAAASASGGLLSSASAAPASPLIPVEDAVGGMMDVLEAAVGVRLVRVGLREGEGWADGVAKFAAVDVSDNESFSKKSLDSLSSLDKNVDPSRVLGDVYLDLSPRPAKFPGAAHFTLRCGRGGGDPLGLEESGGRAPPSAAARPAVAIVASFSGLRERTPGASSSSSSSLAPLPWLGSLAWSETTTLLHEGGHALHSLLSRTEFQHLSGTRGPLDVVELPSHVAERWARLPAAGPPFGSPSAAAGAAAAALATRGRVSAVDFVAAEAARRATGALDFLVQVTDALVDAELHRGGSGDGSGEGFFDAAAAAADAAELVAALSPLPHPQPPSFNPHARFGHLAGYGGAYYSYVYAECVAADVCARSAGAGGSRGGRGGSSGGKNFGTDDYDETELVHRALRSGGEALRESLLRHGCSAPPREAVRELLARSSTGGGGGGEEAEESGSNQGGREKREKKGGGWSPDPRARLAEVGVI